MNTFAKFLPLGLLLTACGSMRETAQVRDDVYDIPDRSAVASVASEPAEDRAPAPASDRENDYYDAGQARDAGVYRDYYDMTYNDPYYYNQGRFGFGTSMGTYGSSFGMSYGWPTSWGSMSIGYGYGFGNPYWGGGYDPYWGNSWMSGYGYGNPWGYYGYGNYGYGYGGYGWSPYQGPWGGCYGCYEPVGYSSVVYGHRPSMTGPSGNMNTSQTGSRRAYRNPAGLMQPAESGLRPSNARSGVKYPTGRTEQTRTREGRNNNGNVYTRPARNGGESTRPARNWSIGGDGSPSRGGGDSSPSRSGGGGGGGRTTSPRPR